MRHSRQLQLTTLSDLFQWVPSASAMDRRYTQISEICVKLAQFSTIPAVKMDRIVLLEYVASAYDVHIFSSPIAAGLPAKLI